AFYFAARKKRSSIFLVIGYLLLIMVILSCSRGSIVGAVFAFFASLVYTFIKCNNKKEFRIAALAMLGIVVVSLLIFHKQLAPIFSHVPVIGQVDENGSLVVNDSGRFNIYKNGWESFLRNPIFGQSFYPVEFDIYSFANLAQFNSFFPPRWHNTVIQLLASCGIVGMLAYGYHRFDTIRLYIKKRSLTNTYVAFCIITLLLMSLLDCHFFNVGPVLFYSIALAVMEFGQEKAIEAPQNTQK
ncbi:MAG: O-antigen ligase family protein, partial [Clostridia bacterium]|nr:O-antigen ligase family protein [Clostridia bacterium]